MWPGNEYLSCKENKVKEVWFNEFLNQTVHGCFKYTY